MVTRTDRLFCELDRQLVEVRVLGEGVAARVGVLTSSTAIAAGLFSSRSSSSIDSLSLASAGALGVSLVLGVLVLSPSMIIGPTTTELALWTDAGRLLTVSDMYASKLVALEANRRRLRTMRRIFTAQLVFAISALVLIVAAARGIGSR